MRSWASDTTPGILIPPNVTTSTSRERRFLGYRWADRRLGSRGLSKLWPGTFASATWGSLALSSGKVMRPCHNLGQVSRRGRGWSPCHNLGAAPAVCEDPRKLSAEDWVPLVHRLESVTAREAAGMHAVVAVPLPGE